MLNSWFHNVESLKRPKHRDNPLFIHPVDAEARQLTDGSMVAVFNAFGKVSTRIAFDTSLRPGVVAMTHGWGHQNATLSTVAAYPGVNANELLPSGPDSFEPFSNQSFMTGIPIDIQAEG
jgi:anaerobic selenocysteine-containing dehydrogenase